MLAATFMEQIGGVKTIVLVVAALLIALYLRSLSRREKRETIHETLTADKLAALPDGQVVNAVIKDMLAACEAAKKEPYRMAATWSNPQVNVYSVWATVKELELTVFSTLEGTPAGQFLPFSVEGFHQIGAPACAAAVEAADDDAFSAAVAAEQPLTLCVEYIRDNAEAFVEE